MRLPELIVFLLLAFLCLSQQASAATDAVTIDLTPSSIALGAGETSHVLVILRNPGDSEISNVEVKSLSDLDLTVEPDGAVSHSIPAHGVSAWPMRISQKTPGRSVGKLIFWVTFSTGDPGRASGASFASLDVTEHALMDVNKLVAMKLESAVSQFDQKHPAYLYLVVTNASTTPVTVTTVRADRPPFLFLIPKPAGDPATWDLDEQCKSKSVNVASPIQAIVPPSASKTFPVIACASNNAPIGTQRVILDADLTWIDNGKTRTSTISVAGTLPISVLGESDLLKLIGVPSFLFLPGFLALATFAALWSRTLSASDPELKLSTAETAVAAVTLSIVSAIVYPHFPGNRDYLSGYGLEDIFRVWFGSILFGVAAWTILFAVVSLRRRAVEMQRAREAAVAAEMEAKRVKEITPTKQDTPLQILARMALLSLPCPPPQALVSLAGTPQVRAFVVVPGGAVGQQVWVAPPIELRPKAGTAQEWSRKELIEKLKQDRIFEDLRGLTVLLTAATRAGWELSWGESGAIVGPTPLQQAGVTPTTPQRGFMLIEI
jgi:hypothetical protein